jgi:HK97 gp10 family phage protein
MAPRRNVEGVDKVRAVFRAFSEKSATRVARALNEGVEKIADRARILVPVDTGELKAAIDTRTVGIRTKGRRGGGTTDNLQALAGVFGPRDDTDGVAFRARMVEFRDDGNHTPQPFLFPAFFSVRKNVVNRVRNAMRAAAREVARRGRN